MITEHTIKVSDSIGIVSAISLTPEGSKNLIVLAHGAGAPMTHTDMTDYAEHLAEDGIATLRFNSLLLRMAGKGRMFLKLLMLPFMLL